MIVKALRVLCLFLFRFVLRDYKRDQSLCSLSYFPVDIEFMGSRKVIVNCQNSLSYDDDNDDDENKVMSLFANQEATWD